LPDTISVNNSSLDNNQNAQSLVLGNIYNYNYSDKEMESEIKLKDKEIEFLKEKIISLQTEIANLKEINSFLREKTK
jgi:hypothetical protein